MSKKANSKTEYDIMEDAIKAFAPTQRPSIRDLLIAFDSCEQAIEVAKGNIVHEVVDTTWWAVRRLICETQAESLAELAIKAGVYQRQLEYEDQGGGGFIGKGRAEEMAESIMRDQRRLAKLDREAFKDVINSFKRPADPAEVLSAILHGN